MPFVWPCLSRVLWENTVITLDEPNTSKKTQSTLLTQPGRCSLDADGELSAQRQRNSKPRTKDTRWNSEINHRRESGLLESRLNGYVNEK